MPGFIGENLRRKGSGFIRFPGRHDIKEEPQVAILAEKLTDSLDRAQNANPGVTA
jgi:hypothetical protein